MAHMALGMQKNLDYMQYIGRFLLSNLKLCDKYKLTILLGIGGLNCIIWWQTRGGAMQPHRKYCVDHTILIF